MLKGSTEIFFYVIIDFASISLRSKHLVLSMKVLISVMNFVGSHSKVWCLVGSKYFVSGLR